MRHDLGRCVIEAPRGNSSAPSAKVRHFGRITHDDEGYDYEGLTKLPSSHRQCKFARIGEKSFSDKLGPLRNYLQSRCGHPWNDTYSEIQHHMGRMHSPGLSHIKKDHLDVATHTFRDGAGTVWNCDKHGVHPIESWRFRGHFYVEPETGLLRHAPYHEVPFPSRVDPNIIPITGASEFRKIKGIWYYQQFCRSTLKTETGRTFRGKMQYDSEDIVTVLRKRQLGKRELKQFTLQNG